MRRAPLLVVLGLAACRTHAPATPASSPASAPASAPACTGSTAVRVFIKGSAEEPGASFELCAALVVPMNEGPGMYLTPTPRSCTDEIVPKGVSLFVPLYDRDGKPLALDGAEHETWVGLNEPTVSTVLRSSKVTAVVAERRVRGEVSFSRVWPEGEMTGSGAFDAEVCPGVKLP
jgi:hypothetical protein